MFPESTSVSSGLYFSRYLPREGMYVRVCMLASRSPAAPSTQRTHAADTRCESCRNNKDKYGSRCLFVH